MRNYRVCGKQSGEILRVGVNSSCTPNQIFSENCRGRISGSGAVVQKT